LRLELGEPIQILYGLNGAGKSVSLEAINRALIGKVGRDFETQSTTLRFKIQVRKFKGDVPVGLLSEDGKVRENSQQIAVTQLVREVLIDRIRSNIRSDLHDQDLSQIGLRALYKEVIAADLSYLAPRTGFRNYGSNHQGWHIFSPASQYFGSFEGEKRQYENVMKRRTGGEEKWFVNRIDKMADEISKQGLVELHATQTGWAVQVAVVADETVPTVREELELPNEWVEDFFSELDASASNIVLELPEDAQEYGYGIASDLLEEGLIEELYRKCEMSILNPYPEPDIYSDMADSVAWDVEASEWFPFPEGYASNYFPRIGMIDLQRQGQKTNSALAGGILNEIGNLFPVLGLAGEEVEPLTRAALNVPRKDDSEDEVISKTIEIDRQFLMLKLGTRATELLAEMLPDAPPLTLGFATPEDQTLGTFELWRARDRSGEDLVIADLSTATKRLANLAIQIALAEETRPDDLKILLLDEPDLGLHRSAERVLFAALERLGAKTNFLVVVATHSPLALGLRTAKLHHVTRNDDGGIDFKKLSLKSKDQLHVLGLSISDTLALTRVFMIVEGRHDEIVLSELFAGIPGGFKDLGIEILPMHGGRNAGSVIDSTLLWDYTDAKVAVVLDRVPHEALKSLWDYAVTTLRDTPDSRYEISEEFRNGVTEQMSKLIPGSARPDEITWITNLGTKALQSGRPERLALLGLPEDDILAYVPPDLLGAANWQKAKKNLTEEQLRAAVQMMGEVPQDLTEVYESVARLAK